ncbi:hypothetical protein ACJJIE_04630 [Microbulbifer sp. TRSA001]|uniref:hypothetical protein n=1 Tax=Microbulbifer sp. TRSA001 TaxID=3243381 RepID=UPI004039BA19
MTIDVFNLFEADTKKEVDKICSALTLKTSDLIYLVKLSEAKIIEFPYLHACKYLEETPENIRFTDRNIQAIKGNGVGKLSLDAKKAVNKLFQSPRFVKRTTAHMFYRIDQRYWHMFFFDLKDIAVNSNHWEYGEHIHYVSWLWPNLKCGEVWSKFCQLGKRSIGGTMHIRFEK